MEVVRTPEERFERLPGWDFEPRYIDIYAGDGTSLRMHYVDEGPADAPIVLMLHGEPSWSYLYRKMIPTIARAGLRAVVPDLIGFGRSDKPTDRAAYTYAGHVSWVLQLIGALNLTDLNLVCQDWGGLIGLRLAAENPDRFARVITSNTFLPTGDQTLGDAFLRWRDHSQRVETLDIARVISSGCVTKPSDEVLRGYEAPFPDESYKEAARAFPMLVPASPEDPAAAANRRAWEVLGSWTKPVLTAFGDSDPVTRGADLMIQAIIPGASGRPHVTIEGAGHFIQEDKGEELARVTVEFIGSS